MKELGIRHRFGVPGDCVLGFNAQIEARGDAAWVAKCNELNAADAAEGLGTTAAPLGIAVMLHEPLRVRPVTYMVVQ